MTLLFKLHEMWSVDSQESHYNCCHQKPDFKAKMHQIQFQTNLPWLGRAMRCVARKNEWINTIDYSRTISYLQNTGTAEY